MSNQAFVEGKVIRETAKAIQLQIRADMVNGGKATERLIKIWLPKSRSHLQSLRIDWADITLDGAMTEKWLVSAKLDDAADFFQSRISAPVYLPDEDNRVKYLTSN